MHALPYLLPNLTPIMIFFLFNRQIFPILLYWRIFWILVVHISRSVISHSVALVIQSLSCSVVSHSVVSHSVVSRSVVRRSVVAPGQPINMELLYITSEVVSSVPTWDAVLVADPPIYR